MLPPRLYFLRQILGPNSGAKGSHRQPGGRGDREERERRKSEHPYMVVQANRTAKGVKLDGLPKATQFPVFVSSFCITL